MKTVLGVLVLMAAFTIGAGAQINPPKPPPPATQPPATPQPPAVPHVGPTPQPPRPPMPADPFARCLFSPEEVMAHQGEIGLQDDQRAKLSVEASRAQAKAAEVQWSLSGEQQKLETLMRGARVDEGAVLKAVDRILALEQDLKRTQMTMMVRVKNTLTEQQQTRLRELRHHPVDGFFHGVWPAGASPHITTADCG